MKTKSFFLYPFRTAAVYLSVTILCIFSVAMPIRWISVQGISDFMTSGYILYAVFFITVSVLALLAVRSGGYRSFGYLEMKNDALRLNGFFHTPIIINYDDIRYVDIERYLHENYVGRREYRYTIHLCTTYIKPSDRRAAAKMGKCIRFPLTERRMEAMRKAFPPALEAKLSNEFRMKQKKS